MFVAIGFSRLQDVFAWNVLIAGAGAISLFCAWFHMVSLGLKDVAFRGSDRTRGHTGGTRRLSHQGLTANLRWHRPDTAPNR